MIFEVLRGGPADHLGVGRLPQFAHGWSPSILIRGVWPRIIGGLVIDREAPEPAIASSGSATVSRGWLSVSRRAGSSLWLLPQRAGWQRAGGCVTAGSTGTGLRVSGSLIAAIPGPARAAPCH